MERIIFCYLVGNAIAVLVLILDGTVKRPVNELFEYMPIWMYLAVIPTLLIMPMIRLLYLALSYIPFK